VAVASSINPQASGNLAAVPLELAAVVDVSPPPLAVVVADIVGLPPATAFGVVGSEVAAESSPPHPANSSAATTATPYIVGTRIVRTRIVGTRIVDPRSPEPSAGPRLPAPAWICRDHGHAIT
jgi:hypothetical protein